MSTSGHSFNVLPDLSKPAKLYRQSLACQNSVTATFLLPDLGQVSAKTSICGAPATSEPTQQRIRCRIWRQTSHDVYIQGGGCLCLLLPATVARSANPRKL
jgi:hypothetical protein